MPTSSPSPVRRLSSCIVKPSGLPPSGERCHMTIWDLSMLSAVYIQKGLLFSNCLHFLTIYEVATRLKSSLSAALLHFYPLAGRFITEYAHNDAGNVSGMYVYIDCAGQGAEFIHSVADGITVTDVLAPSGDVPPFIRSFFPFDLDVNHDGHHQPLVAVQLTELVDGFFVGCAFNHAIGDGTSYWNFFNSWAEIARSTMDGASTSLSRPPVHNRWFIGSYPGPPIKLPYTHPDEFVEKFTPPLFREKIFHFSAESIALLKAKANKECGKESTVISSFQSVAALLWRCITRARRLPTDQKTNCRVAIENRSRLRPRLSPDYFGNSIYPMATTTSVGELLAHDLGWAAWQVHEAVAGHNDTAIRTAVEAWMTAPKIYNLSLFDNRSVMMGSSPRFDVYGCDFGWGKAVAVRSGIAHKFDGKATLYPGWEGRGSMDLEVILTPEFMEALEADEEFTSVASPPLELDVLLAGN